MDPKLKKEILNKIQKSGTLMQNYIKKKIDNNAQVKPMSLGRQATRNFEFMDFLTKLEVPLKKIQSKVKVDKEKGIFDSDSENEENHINSFDTSTSPSKNQK